MANDFKDKKVGELVVENFEYAPILQKYGIDFCCGGNVSFEKACAKAGANMEKVVKDLNAVSDTEVLAGLDFKTWPLDLLIDYVLKYHHRRIREKAPQIEELLNKVTKAHGANHPELREVRDLFHQASLALHEHLPKEENILFPYVYELMDAAEEGRKPEIFHCGAITNPIGVMEYEHNLEGERFRKISMLTNDYEVPEDACESYKLVMKMLKKFEEDLHQHIHLENNIIFPEAIELQSKEC